MCLDADRPFKDGVIRGIQLETLKVGEDDRGHLVELFRRDETRRMRRPGQPRLEDVPMAYASVTKAGVARGPHEHLNQTDIFIFMRSEFVVFLWDNRPKSPTFWIRQKLVTSAQEYNRLLVPPGVVHAYKAVHEGLVVNCPDQLFAGWDKEKPVDEIRHENDDPAVFKFW